MENEICLAGLFHICVKSGADYKNESLQFCGNDELNPPPIRLG